MPYIKKERRADFKVFLMYTPPTNPGELNYLLTEFARIYLREKGESYQTYNDILGALEGAKLELYRRKISSYEDLKIKENGDVYDLSK